MYIGNFFAGLSISLLFLGTLSDHDSKFPSLILSNGVIGVGIYLPDAEKGYYRGTRFDWSGVISQVEYKGHTYFGEWKETHDPTNHDDITGPVEEFRSGPFDKPSSLGYDVAKPGETFIKIGVGLLEKPEEPSYSFWNRYKIVTPGIWEVSKDDNWVEFHQKFDDGKGWSYEYTKRIVIAKDEPEMTIEHSFKNTGSKPIESSQYNHNFFNIDRTPVGKDYVLKFPFEVKLNRDLKGTLIAEGNQVRLAKDLLNGESIFTEIFGFGNDARDYNIAVENTKTGAGVKIVGDRPLVHLNFWTIKTTICPEPFVDVSVMPGEEKKWRITYTFYTRD